MAVKKKARRQSSQKTPKKQRLTPGQAITKSRIYIAPSNINGWGVFTGQPFKAGDILEICPIIYLEGQEECDWAGCTMLADYAHFVDGEDDEEWAVIPLGYGCFYNHAASPKAWWEFSELGDKWVMVKYALYDMEQDEEITICYSEEYNDDLEIPFKLSDKLGLTSLVKYFQRNKTEESHQEMVEFRARKKLLKSKR